MQFDRVAVKSLVIGFGRDGIQLIAPLEGNTSRCFTSSAVHGGRPADVSWAADGKTAIHMYLDYGKGILTNQRRRLSSLLSKLYFLLLKREEIIEAGFARPYIV